MKNNIKLERVKKNITQQELADKLQVSRQTINAIEANKYLPSTLLALRMAHLFGIKVEDLFQLEPTDLL